MFANGKFKCAENNVEVEWMGKQSQNILQTLDGFFC